MIMFYAISQLAMRFFAPQTPQPKTQSTVDITYDQNGGPVSQDGPNPWMQDPQKINPVWPMGSKISVHVYLSQSFGYDLFSKSEREANGNLPHVTWDNLTLGDWKWGQSAEYTVQIPPVASPFVRSLYLN